MAKQDLSEKALIGKTDVFADIINTLVGKGSEIVKAQNLISPNTELIHFNNEQWELKDLFRDICKKDIQNNRIYTIWGIENQQSIDYTMPLRCMGYDYNTYQQQKEELLDKRKQEFGSDKSGKRNRKVHFRKSDKLAPVITLVLYWGKNWDTPRSLHDMLSIPKEISQLERV